MYGYMELRFHLKITCGLRDKNFQLRGEFCKFVDICLNYSVLTTFTKFTKKVLEGKGRGRWMREPGLYKSLLPSREMIGWVFATFICIVNSF